jgi:hypothetical protein
MRYHHTKPNRELAVSVAMGALRRAEDWQDAQDALANHVTVGPWLRGTFGADVLSEVQSIIREAEEQLGDELPY